MIKVWGGQTSRSMRVVWALRSDRQGIRLAEWLVRALRERGADAKLIDAKAVDLPMLDRMYNELLAGEAPPKLKELAGKIRAADAFVFVTGEHNWGIQPGLKSLTDYFLEKWFWRPAGIVSYSAGRFAGEIGGAVARYLVEIGVVVVSSTNAVGGIGHAFDHAGEPSGDGGAALIRAFPRFADDLAWWTDAARNQRANRDPPY